jgi:hypothetical protein
MAVVLPESQRFDSKIGCQVTRLRGEFETESPLIGVDSGERVDACGTVGRRQRCGAGDQREQKRGEREHQRIVGEVP